MPNMGKDFLNTVQSQSLSELDGAESLNAYSIGWLLVHSIIQAQGVATLHDLCQQAEEEELGEVPFSWVMQASGVTPDLDGFRALLHRTLQPREREKILLEEYRRL